MEYCSELKRNTRDQQTFGTSDKTKLPQSIPSINLQDRINLEKPDLSYADFHHEIMKRVKDISPKSPGNHQKQQVGRKGNEEDELVKYMSKLPSYLERGKNPKEKVLNVGVLDWGRLEKWQCGQKQMPHRSSGSSLSSSNLSSSFSTDASSSNSSRGYIYSPDRQMMRRPSLQFHLKSSPVEGHSHVAKSLGESVGKFPDLRDSQSNNLNKEGIIRTDQSFDRSHQEISPSECKRKNLDAKISQESGTLPNGVKYEVLSSRKGKMKNQDVQFMKKTEKLQQGNQNIDQDVHGKQNTVVLLLPRDLPENNLSGVSNLSASTTMLGERPSEASRRSFSGTSKDADLNFHVPLSGPLPCEVDSSKNLLMKRTSFIETKSGKPSGRSQSVPCSARFGTCPSSCGNLEDRKSTVTINKPSANGPFVGADLNVSKVVPEKGRSTSPFRRLSFSMGKIGKFSSSKETPIFSKSSSTYVSGQSGLENTVASSGPNISNSDKSNATSRSRSSPLRRLLDPILKPKPANCHNVAEPLPRDLISKDRASKSFDGRPYSSTVAGQPGRVKLNMTGCKTINVNDSFQEKKHGSTVQALLRVAVKNGQPLYTFAVGNESDILAATVKKLSTSRKEDYSCIYTFFTIQEVKKKNGRWLNQGSKGQSHDYIPNVVAQMKVFGSHFPNMSREINYVDQFSMREFVLFSVELRQSDHQASDFQPNDELAAIAINIPLKVCRSSLLDGYQSDAQKDSPQVGFKDSLPEVTFVSGEKLQNRTFASGQDISATVILPSGAHSLPHKGEPSSLIQRWKSGGSCDCGGWDLNCKLRVLTNRNQQSKKASSSKACSRASQFELFYQGGVQENQPPFFSLAPFKDDIYSVEFNSSVPHLEAFSICIAVLDSQKPCVSSESTDSFEEKTPVETMSVPNDGTTALDQSKGGEIPARYVSYPPLSPVGRV
ncbi:hypothetical protein Ddye_023623 [Dipteronia dyeriana]|uniref:Uncharacterized protein n=1 Tax=Dipteronia dyeriana TaxID=168575 RepID=A0AAD9TU83_9ROSI|nr:hypothetical protein Ddye_023623 [Dipteronia dyeriana]